MVAALKVWGRRTSSNVQKVLWGCEELGLPFERIDLGGPFGGNDEPAYREMHPHGRIPTLKDGETVIWESNTILRYLCMKYDGGHLYPSAAVQRSEVERWMDWQIAGLAPQMHILQMAYLKNPNEKPDRAAVDAVSVQWSAVEKFMSSRAYLADETLTLADICNGVLFHRWLGYPIERPSMPKLESWYRRLAARRGFITHVGSVSR
jgi:glutathione S-transferase